jgi:endonuclease I
MKSWIKIPFLFFCLAGGLPLAYGQPNPPTNLLFFQIRPWQLSLSFIASNADGYIILRNRSGVVPVLNDKPQVSQFFGDAKVLFIGQGTLFTDRQVLANNRYYYFVFSYSMSGDSMECSVIPLSQSVQTPSYVSSPKGYYGAITDMKGPLFMDRMSDLLYQHQLLNYSSFGFDLARDIHLSDTLNQQQFLVCQYSKEKVLFSGNFGFSTIGYSREHVMPRSWMPTGGNTSQKDGADYHNLLIVNNYINNVRSNYPFQHVQTVSQSFFSSALGIGEDGDVVFEPADDVKGDVARCIFYMQLAYNRKGGVPWGFRYLSSRGPQQSFKLLLRWHLDDPPDPFEMTRHEYISYFQENRNPFIDFPEWVCHIDFNTMEWMEEPHAECLPFFSRSFPYMLDISAEIGVSPNPSKGVYQLRLPFFLIASAIDKIMVINNIGQVVEHEWNEQHQELKITCPPGMYQLMLQTDRMRAVKTLILEP